MSNKLLYKNKNLKKNIYKFLEKSFNMNNDGLNFTNIFVFDIYNVILYDDNKIDENITNFLMKLIRLNYPIIILSKDTDVERIKFNEELINTVNKKFENIPKFFTFNKNKGKICKHIREYMLKNNKESTIIMIDDDINNIIDTIKNVDNNYLLSFNYTKHTIQNKLSDNILLFEKILIKNNINI